MDKSIEKYRKRRLKRLRSRGIRCDWEKQSNEYDWITMTNGEHVPIGEGGIAAGGPLKGRDFSKATSVRGHGANRTAHSYANNPPKKEKTEQKKTKRAATKIDNKMLPGPMTTGAQGKNVSKFIDYINNSCNDADVMDLLGSGNIEGGKENKRISKVSKSMNGDGCRITYGGWIGDKNVEIKVPNMSKCKTENEKKIMVGSFVHEYTHFLDLKAGAGNEHFTKNRMKLQEALVEERGLGIDSPKLTEYLTEYTKQRNELIEKTKSEFKRVEEETIKSVYGEKPDWLINGTSYSAMLIPRWGTPEYKTWNATFAEYAKKLKKATNEVENNRKRACRAIMGGVTSLQGLYDSVSGGKLFSMGKGYYGHSPSYFNKDDSNRGVEVLADYMALKVINPEMLECFKQDRPKTAAAIEECIADLTKELRGS